MVNCVAASFDHDTTMLRLSALKIKFVFTDFITGKQTSTLCEPLQPNPKKLDAAVIEHRIAGKCQQRISQL